MDPSIPELRLGQTLQGQLAPGDHKGNTLFSDNPIYIDRYRLRVRAGQRVQLFLNGGAPNNMTVVTKGNTDDKRLRFITESQVPGGYRRAMKSDIDQDVLLQVTTPYGPPASNPPYTLMARVVGDKDPAAPAPGALVPGGSADVVLRGGDYWEDGRLIRDFVFQGRAGQRLIASACCYADDNSMPYLEFLDPSGKEIYDDAVPDDEHVTDPGLRAPANQVRRNYLQVRRDGPHRLRVVVYDEFRTRTTSGRISLAEVAPRPTAGGRPSVKAMRLGGKVDDVFTATSQWEDDSQVATFTANVQPGEYEIWVKSPEDSEGFAATASWPGGTDSERAGSDGLMLFMFKAERAGPVTLRVTHAADFYPIQRPFTVEFDRKR